MPAILNYRKYATPSLSTYPRLNHYNTTHITKEIWVPLPPRTLATLRHWHSRLVIVVTELVLPALTKVPDPSLARVQIRSVMTGVEVGDLDLAYTIVEAVFPSSADLLSMNRRGSGSG